MVATIPGPPPPTVATRRMAGKKVTKTGSGPKAATNRQRSITARATTATAKAYWMAMPPHFFPGCNRHRGGAAETHGPHQDHGGHGQRQQGNGHPDRNRPERAIGARVGRTVSLFEQLPLAALHCGDHAPQFLHDLLAAVGEDDLHGGRLARLPAELDRLPQFGELGVGELLDLLQGLLLQRIIAGQVVQQVDVVMDLAGRRIVRLQILLRTGEDESPLAGLGIREQRQDLFETLDDLMGVRHPAVRFQQVLRAHVGADADRRNDHQPEGKPGADPGSNAHGNCSGVGSLGATLCPSPASGRGERR